jgi:hypothetical protein
MSYVLHLWEQPVPASLAEADQIHTRLSAERTGQNPKFIELAKRLTERYPCMTSLDDDEDGAWSDGPLDGKTDTPVYSLGVQIAMLHEVVPFVAATAIALGLVVYDTQAAEVHLPGGGVLTLPGRAAVDFELQGDPELLDSKSRAVHALMESLTPRLQSLGFKPLAKKASFKRRSKEVEQVLWFDVEESFRSCLIEIFFSAKPMHAERLREIADQHAWSGYMLNLERTAKRAGVKPFGDQPQVNGRSRLGSVQALKDWALALEDFMVRAVIPIADQCRTIMGLDGLVNSVAGDESPFRQYPNVLILAKATSNPRFDEISAQWVQTLPEGPSREKVRKLIAALQALA